MPRAPVRSAGCLAALAVLAAAVTASAQVTFAERLGPSSFRIAGVASPGAAAVAVGGLGPVSFLDLRWTDVIEAFSPRTDIPRQEEFTHGRRIRLPDGSRLYRVLGPQGTAVVLVGDGGAGVLASAAGDGLTSGIAPLAAVSPFDPWIAVSTIGIPGSAPRIILARTDLPAGSATFDVAPPGGWPGLHATSLAFAAGSLFFTTSGGVLWRVPLDTRVPAPVPLPVPSTAIDSEIAVAAGGGTIALRAGPAPQAWRVLAVTVATGAVASFGPPGPTMGVHHSDPRRRPALSVSPDGSLVPHFSSTGATLDLLVGENYGFHFSPLLVAAGVAWLAGVESELAIGDGGQILTFLVPVPGAGNVLVSLPYPVLSFALGILGQSLFTVFQNVFNPFPAVPAGSLAVRGHFQFASGGYRFIVMGPAAAPADLVQLVPGGGGGEIRLSGLDVVHETVRFGGDVLLMRATAAGAASPAVFAVPLPAGPVVTSAILGPGSAIRLAGAPDGESAAFVYSSGPGQSALWRFDRGESAAPAPFAPQSDIGPDLQWRGDGHLAFRTGAGTIQTLSRSGNVTVWILDLAEREIL